MQPTVPTAVPSFGKILGQCPDCDRLTGSCWRHSVRIFVVGEVFIVGEIVPIPTTIILPEILPIPTTITAISEIVPAQDLTWR